MNNRKRNVIIALIVLLGVCVFIAAEKVITRKVETVNYVDQVITQYDPTAYDKISLFRDDISLDLELVDGQWFDKADHTFPISNEAVEEMLTSLNEMHACFLIEGVKNLDPYGLGYPTASLTATGSNGAKQYIALGAYSALDENRYVNVDDGLVYMVEQDPLKYISTNRDDYIDHFSVPMFEKVTAITVSGDDSLKAVYDPDGVYEYSGRYNYYDVQGGGHVPLKDSLVEEFSSFMTRINLKLYVSYNASDEELAQYGLAEPLRSIKVDGVDADGNPVGYTIHVGTVKDGGAADENGAPTDAYYARFEGSRVVYNLSEMNFNVLTSVSRGGLRPPEVFAPDWSKVEGFTFTIEGRSYEVHRELAPEEMQPKPKDDDEEQPEPVYLWYIDGKEFNANNILKNLKNVSVRFYDEKAKRGGEQEFSVTLKLNDDRYKTVKVDVSRADGTYCTVTRDGEVLGYATRVQTTALREALLETVLGSTVTGTASSLGTNNYNHNN